MHRFSFFISVFFQLLPRAQCIQASLCEHTHLGDRWTCGTQRREAFRVSFPAATAALVVAVILWKGREAYNSSHRISWLSPRRAGFATLMSPLFFCFFFLFYIMYHLFYSFTVPQLL